MLMSFNVCFDDFHFLFLYALAVPNVADEVYGAMSMCVDLAMEAGSQQVPQCHQFVLRQDKAECSQQPPSYGISLKSMNVLIIQNDAATIILQYFACTLLCKFCEHLQHRK